MAYRSPELFFNGWGQLGQCLCLLGNGVRASCWLYKEMATPLNIVCHAELAPYAVQGCQWLMTELGTQSTSSCSR